MNIQGMLAYRANLVADLLVSAMWLAVELLSLLVIFSNTNSMAGWSAGELLALMGVWKLLMGFATGIMWPNTERFNASVRDGTLDYTFLMPANSQLLMTMQRISVLQLHNVLQFAILVPIGLSLSGITVTLMGVFSFALLCVGGLVILYSLWIILMAAVFWFTKFDNNVTLIQAVMDAARYPTSVFPPWLRALLTFVIPVGVATTVPLQAIRGDLSPLEVIGFLSMAVITFLISNRVWLAGTRRYAGASA